MIATKKRKIKMVDDYCGDCVYLTKMSGAGETKIPACVYILETGMRRPCPAGKNCKVKEIGKRVPKAP